MHIVRSIFFLWIQFLGQSEERLCVAFKVVNIKDGLWVGDLVLLQVVIKTSARGSETARYKIQSELIIRSSKSTVFNRLLVRIFLINLAYYTWTKFREPLTQST